ncbi:hypothetical protein [Paraburkholderia sp. GAS32]|uniref:hypothetical protein n=1 Tax=Paraburkholderia sp. GAS32 TaxID=3035129 RepID=UPI003D1C0993
MTALRSTVPLILLSAACSPAWPDASTHPGPTAQPDALVPAPVAVNDQKHTTPPANASILSVGVSDPNTQLILPWFLTDIINAINTQTSAGNFLRTAGRSI